MNTWEPNLTWITEQLAVGGSFPIERAQHLARDHRIDAVIDLRGEAMPDKQVLHRHGITLLHLPTEDMCGVEMPDLEHGIRFASEFLDRGGRVLVHCEHGIGRSATLALCLLVHLGHAPLDALALLKERRPLIAPSPPQFECWSDWLDSYRFSHEVEWAVPTFDEFQAVAYRRSRRPG
ncbi:MAG: protein phosphatase [Variovorax sp.]|nr:MAG: protein phosphatase [Variovorax sp.]